MEDFVPHAALNGVRDCRTPCCRIDNLEPRDWKQADRAAGVECLNQVSGDLRQAAAQRVAGDGDTHEEQKNRGQRTISK